jgi:hypothetical protein
MKLEAAKSTPAVKVAPRARVQFETLSLSWPVLVGLVTLAVYLLSMPYVERRWRTTGDEPHYLLTAHSLVQDGDWDLTNNYDQLDYLAFYLSPDIIRQVRLTPDGRQVLSHHLGLPLLIAPAYAVGGRYGVLIFQVILAALLAGVTFKLAYFVSADEIASLLATLAVLFSPPFFFYPYLVYPELIGALLTTTLLYILVTRQPATTGVVIFTLVALTALPWLNRRFIVLAVVLAWLMAGMWRNSKEPDQTRNLTPSMKMFKGGQPPLISLLWGGNKEVLPSLGGVRGRQNDGRWSWPALATLFLPAVSILALAWFNTTFLPPARADFTLPEAHLLWFRLARGLGWLLDQQRGLFIFAPVYLLAVWGLPWLFFQNGGGRSVPRYSRRILLPFIVALGTTTIAGGFWVAWELGPRYLVVALPGLAPLLALAWSRYRQAKLFIAVATLLLALSLANTGIILHQPDLPYQSSLPLYYGEKLNLPLVDLLPNLADYAQIVPDPTAPDAQTVEQDGALVWHAPAGTRRPLVQAEPLTNLPYGRYQVRWPMRLDPESVPAQLASDTELARIAAKYLGGGPALNKIITAADLPADGSFGMVTFDLFNAQVNRWSAPIVFNVTGSGQAALTAQAVELWPNPLSAWVLPYLYLAWLIATAWLAWRLWGRRLKLPSAKHSSGPLAMGPAWALAVSAPLALTGYLFFQQAQDRQTYASLDLQHHIGRPVADPGSFSGHAWQVDPALDPPQKATYGPFDFYEAGRYRVTFRLKLPQVVQPEPEIARLHVRATANFIELATQPVFSTDFNAPHRYQDFSLIVDNPRRQALSFDVQYHAVAPLVIDEVTIDQLAVFNNQ